MTNELKVGEMVHDETSFNLFHAMSATELMDPKMDLGMDRVHIVPTKERLEKDKRPQERRKETMKKKMIKKGRNK